MKFKAPLLFLILFVGLSLDPSLIKAQHEVRNTNFTIWGGYSFNSVKFLGKTANSQTQLFALGYQKQLKNYPNNKTLWYTADIVPYIYFHYPKRDEGNRMVSRSGFGLSPVGFSLTDHTPNQFSSFFRTTGGLIFMESNFPTDDARKLNFTFDITFGGSYRLNSVGVISFGYKFHHISNAETGEENPGLDSNFLFLKFSTQ